MENYKIALNAWKSNPRSTKVSHSEMHHGKELRIEFEGFPDGLAFSRVFGPNGVISSFLHNSPYVHLNELESFVENVKRGRLSTYRKAKSNWDNGKATYQVRKQDQGIHLGMLKKWMVLCIRETFSTFIHRFLRQQCTAYWIGSKTTSRKPLIFPRIRGFTNTSQKSN